MKTSVLSLVLLLLPGVYATSLCPDSCTVDEQVLSCRHLDKRKILDLQLCLDEFPDTVVVDLTYNRVRCNCDLLLLAEKLVDSHVIMFDSTHCSSNTIALCYPGNGTQPKSSASLYHVSGGVFNAKSKTWREEFDVHYQNLWNILTRLRDTSVRHFYLLLLMRNVRKTEWRVEMIPGEGGPATESVQGVLNTNGTTEGTATDPSKSILAKVKHYLTNERKVKVIVFSGIVGGMVLGVIFVLICRLEYERQKMVKGKRRGDLYLDPGTHSRLHNWISFLEKLSLYKKQKADLVARRECRETLSAKRFFVNQAKVHSTGSIVDNANGQAAAVTSLTKLVPQQPLNVDEHGTYTASVTMEDPGRPLKSETHSPAGCGSSSTANKDSVKIERKNVDPGDKEERTSLSENFEKNDFITEEKPTSTLERK